MERKREYIDRLITLGGAVDIHLVTGEVINAVCLRACEDDLLYFEALDGVPAFVVLADVVRSLPNNIVQRSERATVLGRTSDPRPGLPQQGIPPATGAKSLQSSAPTHGTGESGIRTQAVLPSRSGPSAGSVHAPHPSTDAGPSPSIPEPTAQPPATARVPNRVPPTRVDPEPGVRGPLPPSPRAPEPAPKQAVLARATATASGDNGWVYQDAPSKSKDDEWMRSVERELAHSLRARHVPALIRQRPTFAASAATLPTNKAKQAWTNAVDCYSAGKYVNALRQFAEVAKHYPSEPRASHNAGCCAFRAGQAEQAAQHFARAVRAGLGESVDGVAACLLARPDELVVTCGPEIVATGASAELVAVVAAAAIRRRSMPLAQSALRLLDAGPPLAGKFGELVRQNAALACRLGDGALAEAAANGATSFATPVSSPKSVALSVPDQPRPVVVSASATDQPRSAVGVANAPPGPTPVRAPILATVKSTDARLPKTIRGAYQAAKNAQLEQRNLDAAEGFYREAILSRDHFEAAVKDLALLLQQKGRVPDAIDLLTAEMPRLTDKRSAYNILATIYQHAQLHSEAIPVLRQILVLTPGERQRVSVRQRLALSLLKAQHYDAAEKELRRIVDAQPANATAANWLAALDKARSSGSYQQVEEYFVLDSTGGMLGEITPFAQGMMERSNYEGVRASVVESGTFTLRDVEELEEHAKKLGTELPKDRGRYYLSAAKILFQITPQNTDRVRDYLRRAFSSTGLAAVQDRKPWDVARAYWCEAFAASAEWGFEPLDTMARYILTLVRDHSLVLSKMGPLRDALTKVFKVLQAREQLFELIAYVSLFNSTDAERVLRAVHQIPEIRAAALEYLAGFTTIPDDPPTAIQFIRLWQEPCSKMARSLRNLQNRLAASLLRLSASADSFQDLAHDIRSIRDESFIELDRERLLALSRIISDSATYFGHIVFEEKERLRSLVDTEVTSFCAEIDEGATQVSLRYLAPLAKKAREIVTEDFDRVLRSAEPVLTTRLAVEHYHGREQNDIVLQVELSNRAGCSPVSGVSLQLLPEREYFEHGESSVAGESLGDIGMPGVLRGDASRTLHIPLKLTTRALHDGFFNVEVTGTYRVRDGGTRELPRSRFPVRVYPPGSWADIHNPFQHGARGGPVMDPKMFYGREALLRSLVSAVSDTTPGKCVVLYGQKRVGKSSVLEHLRQRMQWPLVPVDFSLGNTITNFSVHFFLWTILYQTARAVRAQSTHGRKLPIIDVPTLTELSAGGLSLFYQKMDDFADRCKADPVTRDLRVILLIDEFVYLYKAIHDKVIPGEFMKTWKALLQHGYFNAVLVGHDVMPQFMNAYPNEFAVAVPVRCSYLSEEDARKLADVPIRIGGPTGESRYVGTALDDIIDLTDCNPFYIQIVCDAVVEYMNRERTPKITNADVMKVLEQLLRGESAIKQRDFDGLLTPGDELPGAIPVSEVLQVLKRIASYSSHGGCGLADLTGIATTHPIEMILSNLVDRDVIEIRNEAHYIRVGLFREWLNECLPLKGVDAR